MPAYLDQKMKTWYAMFYYIDWKGDRRKKLKRGFKLKRDAEAWESEFKAKESKSSDMTFDSLVDLYFEDMEPRLKESTMDTKRNIIETKIRPYFKKHQINQIHAPNIRKWQAEMLKKGWKPTYLRTINNQLSAIMNYAVRYYKLPENPVRVAGSMGKKNADAMLFWTLDEFRQFISVVDKPAFRLAFNILFWSGIREGELLALEPSHILPLPAIDVKQTLYRKKGEDIIQEPKTPKSNRVVTIPEFLHDEIKGYLKSIYDLEGMERIFYFTKSGLTANMINYAEMAGVKRIRVHDLRHSHAALCIDMGIEIMALSERLGHENVETTWNTYGHLYPDKNVQVALKLQDLGILESS